jgi:dephospho-CoA kinase
MMKILGLTGSIATGKSFVADIFKQNNIIIFSSDKEVAKLLGDSKVIEFIKNIPSLFCAVKDDAIDKNILSNIVFNCNNSLKLLENILHPLLNIKREEFVYQHKNEKFMLFEVPLLFEKEYQSLCYKVITTYCSEKTQIERALRRKNIDKNRLDFIMKQQMLGSLKAKLTDYLIYTDISYQYTQHQVEQILFKEGIK